MQEELVIGWSRFKLFFMIVGSLIFVIGGFNLLFISPGHGILNSPVFRLGTGFFSIFFFGACVVFGMKKFLGGGVGLILNSRGIFDYSSAISAGFIPWEDISGLEQTEMLQQKLLVLKMKEPEKYIRRGGVIKRLLNRANFRLCGSPVALFNGSLKISFTELYEGVSYFFLKYSRPSDGTDQDFSSCQWE